MGFLSDFFEDREEEPEGLPPEVAMLDALCLMIGRDGEVGAEELGRVLALAKDIHPYRDRSDEDLRPHVEASLARLAEEGDHEASLERISEELGNARGREHVYCLLLLLREVEEEEVEEDEDFFELAAHHLEVSGERAEALHEEVLEALSGGGEEEGPPPPPGL